MKLRMNHNSDINSEIILPLETHISFFILILSYLFSYYRNQNMRRDSPVLTTDEF